MFLLMLYDLTPFQYTAEHFSCLDLAAMGTHLLQTIIEWLDASVVGLKAHCSEQVEAVNQMPAVDEGLDAVGTHELGAVEECETLFRLKSYRCPSEFCEHFGSSHPFTLIFHHTFADERQEEVGERGKIA